MEGQECDLALPLFCYPILSVALPGSPPAPGNGPFVARIRRDIVQGGAMRASLTGIVCGAALLAAGPAAAQREGAPAAPVTIAGCVAEQTEPVGTSGRGAGESRARGLLLTEAATRPASGDAPTAVPGSRPSGQDSGTIPASPASQPPAAAAPRDSTYALLGSRASELEKYVGQRVEVVGTLDLEIAAEQPPRPESATVDGRGRAPEREGNPDGSTDRPAARGRTEPVPPSAAHPAAEPLRLTVTSFKPIAGACKQNP